ncbi:MAG: PH domain-containing protein [Candidatus Nitrosopolaris sp.]
MNIKEILSENEKIQYIGQQKRLVPSGKEWLPGKICITDQRVILETTSMLGIKKSYEDLHYSDIESINFKKNFFSCELILNSRFQGAISIHSISKKDAENLERTINQYVSNYRYGFGGQGQGQGSQQPEPPQQPGPGYQPPKKGFWKR